MAPVDACTATSLIAEIDASTVALMITCQTTANYTLLPPTQQPDEATVKRICTNCTDFVAAANSTVFPSCTVSFNNGTDNSSDTSAATFFANLLQPCMPKSSGVPSPAPVVLITSGGSSTNIGLIVGVVAGVVALAIIVFIAFRCGQRRRRQEKSVDENTQNKDVVEPPPIDYIGLNKTPRPSLRRTDQESSTKSTERSSNDSEVLALRMRSNSQGLMNDPSILTVRIPYDAIRFDELVSRGSYGEVYRGSYKGETVAIKQLLPEKRKDLSQINAFISEIKLMASMEHARIVRFIGVSWTSLSDACVIVEFMENGDLRSVLARWNDENERRPQGFDSDKIKIALYIAHALTYLHSLQPVVLHRDLKSKNILLNDDFDAKLTDFGVSRERADSTMTAGVGSSLWMAPEVMLGERYNESADVFSFGVVLSELDTQKLPYSHAKQPGTDRPLPATAILQLVSLGRLTVEFTEHADPVLVQLGRDCVAHDPNNRPNAAEVLHRVHQVMYRKSPSS